MHVRRKLFVAFFFCMLILPGSSTILKNYHFSRKQKWCIKRLSHRKKNILKVFAVLESLLPHNCNHCERGLFGASECVTTVSEGLFRIELAVRFLFIVGKELEMKSFVLHSIHQLIAGGNRPENFTATGSQGPRHNQCPVIARTPRMASSQE